MTDQPRTAEVEIADEAVAAAEREVARWPRDNYGKPYISNVPNGQAAAVRTLLAAARPFMTSRPALDREALFRLLHEQGCGCDLAVEPHTAGDQDWLHGHRSQYEARVDDVMALAVPVPTEEAIAEALATSARDVWPSTPAWADMANSGRESYYRSARAVLALLNGGESS